MNNPNLLGASAHVNQATKANRKSKSSSGGGSKKKQGVKVVYISNPMKVRTSASDFRALVQELTGRDSEPDPARFSEYSSPDNNFISDVLPNSTVQIGGDHHHHSHHPDALDLEVATPTQEQPQSSSSNTLLQFELYNDLFVPEMIDNFGGLLPSSVLYGSSLTTYSSNVDVLKIKP